MSIQPGISAPRCVNCNCECPNGLTDYPFLVVCQNPECTSYGLFQMGDDGMERLNKKYPFKK